MYLFQSIALFTLIICLFFLKLNKKNKYIYFYVVTTFIIEVVAILVPNKTNYDNYFIYNIYTYLEYTIHFLILYQLFENIKSKRLTRNILIFFWFTISITNIFKLEGFFNDQIYLYTFVTILFLYLCLKYFFEIFNSNKYYEFDRSVFFWFLLGIVVFNISYLPLMYANKYLLNNEYYLNRFLTLFLNILKNGFIIFGIIWSQRK